MAEKTPASGKHAPPSTTDMPGPRLPLTALRLILRPGLQIDHNPVSGRYTIEDGLRGRYFETGSEEHALMMEFDGRRTVGEIAGGGGPDGGRRTAKTEAVAQWLIQHNLAVVEESDNAGRLSAQIRQTRRQQWLNWINPLAIRIRLFNPQPWLNRSGRLGQVLFNRWSLAVWLVLMTAALLTAVTHRSEFRSDYAGILSGYRWIWLLGVWAGLKVVHEAGHALACHRFGGRCSEAGIFFLLFTPMAWVDVSACWKFQSRWQRIVVSSAGMYVELAVAAVCLLVWSALPAHSVLRDLCFQTVLMASVTTVLFNANPLMKFDGYFILADGVGITNLYARGSESIRSFWQWAVLGWSAPAPAAGSRFETWLIPVYGGLSAVWRVLVGFGLILAASVMFQGAGVLLAVLAGLTWYAIPAWRQMEALRRAAVSRQVDWRRMKLVPGCGLALLVAAGWLLQSPAVQSAPAVVQLKDEQVLRAVHAGFVREVLVGDGQSVTAGQPLVVLHDPELELQLRTLELKLASSRMKSRSLLDQKKLAVWQAENDTALSLEQQVDENRRLLQGMTVTAPFDGRVVCREIGALPGRYLAQGQTVLTVSRDDSREIIVSLSQDSNPALEQLSEQPMKAVFAGVPVLLCRVTRVHPRADSRPVHPALCAPCGGPLPVRAVESRPREDGSGSEPELLEPRFNISLTPVDPDAAGLAAGQTGRVIFASRRYSLGAWCWSSLQRWVRDKIRIATSAH